jgi:hypothetical protein
MKAIMIMILSLRVALENDEHEINFKFNEQFSKVDVHEKSAMLTEAIIRTLQEKGKIIFID